MGSMYSNPFIHPKKIPTAAMVVGIHLFICTHRCTLFIFCSTQPPLLRVTLKSKVYGLSLSQSNNAIPHDIIMFHIFNMYRIKPPRLERLLC